VVRRRVHAHTPWYGLCVDDGITETLDFRAAFESAPDLYLLLRADSPRFTIAGVSDEYLRATLTTRGRRDACAAILTGWWDDGYQTV